jgi:Fe-S oxidoreductase
MKIEKHIDKIYTCNRTRCGFCIDDCPSYREVGVDFYTSRGRLMISRGLVEGIIKPSPQVAKAVYECTLCGYCEYKCALENVKILEALRGTIKELGFEPEQCKYIVASLHSNENPYMKLKGNRGLWIRGLDIKRKGRILYFAGCTISYSNYLKGNARSIVKILQKIGLNPAYLASKEFCCGAFLHMLGYEEEFQRRVKRNYRVIRNSKCDTIVTSCPFCYLTLKKEYGEVIGIKYDFEVLHITQILKESIDSGRLNPALKVNTTVTYHDPCHLGRFMRVFEEPREVIRAIPGVSLVEMRKNRFESHCCGGGGVLLAINPDMAFSIASKRLSEAVETGAKAVVSSCPICVEMFKRKIKYEGIRFKAYDIVELIAKVLK